jgi:5-methylcytosine-specific restriction enzyme subunit McrC
VLINSISLFEFEKLPYEETQSEEGYDEIAKKAYLTKETIDALDSTNKQKPFFNIGRHEISALNYVGVVKTRKITLQILPKICSGSDLESIDRTIINLMKMISYTEFLRTEEVEYSDLLIKKITDKSLLELFINIFCKRLLKTLKVRQNLEYQRVSNELTVVRGRMDFNQYNNPANFHKVHCTYFLRDADNTINRALRYVSYLMSRITNWIENFRLLKKISAILDLVSLAPISLHELDHICFNRLNLDFKPLIELCKVFLSSSTLTLQASAIQTFAFMIPMETLFQGFIGKVIEDNKEKLGFSNHTIRTQQGIGYLAESYDGKRSFQLVPDITIYNETIALVIDTKYKRLDPDDRKLGVSSADMYQMYAYANKLNIKKVMLLYPKLEALTPRNWFFKNKNQQNEIELSVRFVDISGDLINNWNGWINELSRLLQGGFLGAELAAGINA